MEIIIAYTVFLIAVAFSSFHFISIQGGFLFLIWAVRNPL